MTSTVVAKKPYERWDIKSLLFAQLSERLERVVPSAQVFLLLTSHIFLFFFLLFMASPPFSLPPTSLAVVLSCSFVNV